MARRFAVSVCTALVFLALVGASYQAIGSWREARRSPEPGRFVDIGGMRLKLNCIGSGSPTVVLESGLGDVLIEWRRVQPEIARFTRVCSYDRAGYGGSDAGPMPRTSARSAEELHALLQHAGERPPYLLVGHSYGGYVVRVFNGKYADEVRGIVLADSTQEDQYELLPDAWKRVGAAMLDRYQNQARWAPVFIDLGVARLMLSLRGVHDAYLILQSKYVRARASELESIRVSAEQARAADHIGDKPLVVLTGARNADPILRTSMSAADVDGISGSGWTNCRCGWRDCLRGQNGWCCRTLGMTFRTTVRMRS